VLGPLIGVAVGLICVFALDQVRRHFGMRRDYESLYTLGVALTAFAAAEALHTSGYLAAFAAGMAIAFRDVELCDCFHDYGEATAEAALLLTFVALGGSLIWTGLERIDGPHLIFAAIALAARPLVLLLVLRFHRIHGRHLFMLAWFGPRGLSSLLLILVPVFAGVAEGGALFAITSLVVLISVVIHGASPALLAREGPAGHGAAGETADRITLEEVRTLEQSGQAVFVLDVRKQATFAQQPEMKPGVLRVNPDYVVDEVRRMGLPRDAWLALYCT
jgi:sodium/hydrogen antiporter